MAFLKFLRTKTSELPQTITNGFLYFVKSNRAIYMDHDNERIRYNPPANWNETNTNDASYIANKPTTVSGYGITDAVSRSTADIGASNKGVYVDDGVATAMSYEVNKTVPSNAVFNDTQYAFAQGDANGQIKITKTITPANTVTSENIDVKGLGSAAYTNSVAYATSTQGETADSAVQSIKIQGSNTEYNNSTNVVLPNTYPASDVYSWAKAETKPTYTAAEVNAYSKTEIDNKFSELNSGIDWKESVATYNDIATEYPNPQDGWTVNVKDTDYTYRYNGTSWVAISANAIPNSSATQTTVDGHKVISGGTGGLVTAHQAEKILECEDHESRIGVVEGLIANGDISIDVTCTQAEYDALVLAGEVDPDRTYYITDGNTLYNEAGLVTYSNTTSGLTATNVQAAVDELDGRLDNTATSTTSFTSGDVAENAITASTTYDNQIAALTSGETHSSIFGKVSNMFKNVRYLNYRMATAISNILGDFATTNEGTRTTFSKDYNPDEYFVWHEHLYKVTGTGVASGETISGNSNISQTDVGQEMTSMQSSIDSLNSKGVGLNNNQGTGIYCNWEKIGNAVVVTGVLSHEATSWTIFEGLPFANISDSDSAGVIIGKIPKGDVCMTNIGTLQVRTSPFSERYNFVGSYLCK